MAIREKGGMYCEACKRPVAARRDGHAVRNSAGLLGAVPTLGLSLLATKSERWHCPHCGGPVVRSAFRRTARASWEPVDFGDTPVTLVAVGPRVIGPIKVFRAATQTGLAQAKAAIESAPVLIGYFDADIAEKLVRDFEAAGSTAEIASSEPEVAANDGLADELRSLAELHAAGSLTDDEFSAAKARLLAGA